MFILTRPTRRTSIAGVMLMLSAPIGLDLSRNLPKPSGKDSGRTLLGIGKGGTECFVQVVPFS